MNRDNILPVLYDLVVTIGGETRLKPLLTHTLQRLLYHTSFSAGFICLDVVPCRAQDGYIDTRIDAAVGDFDLVGLVGKPVRLPSGLVCCTSENGADLDDKSLSASWPTQAHYHAALRLPIEQYGVIVLLAASLPETKLPLRQMLQPVLAHLAKSIILCRSNDARIAAAEAQKSLLRQSQANFDSLIDLSPIGVRVSTAGITVNVNQVFLKMFGYELADEVCGKPLLMLIAEQSRAAMSTRIKRREQGLPVENSYEIAGLRKNGTEFPLLVYAKRVEFDEGPRTFTYFIDLTAQKETEQALRSSNERLEAVLENVPLRIFWKDTALHYLGCNTAFARDAGMSRPEEVIGKCDTQLAWQDQAELYRLDDNSVIESNQSKLGFEESRTQPDGQDIWLRKSKVPLHDAAGNVVGVLGIYDDITEQKRADAKIHQLAFYDPLTNLPNRRLLLEQLQQAFTTGAKNGQYGAVLLLDLDNFKTLNDSKGHYVGDLLLVEVAERIGRAVPTGDIVARFGGDEFVVVMQALGSLPDEAAKNAEAIAEQIRDALGKPYQLDYHLHHTTPSIGVVLFRGHQQSLDDVLKHADTAMYQAKSAGRNVVRFYDPAMQAAIVARAELEEDLRYALDKNQFQLHYQVQVNSLGRPLGAEVLLRWQHPERGSISPAQFIPLAEDTGLIVPIGKWVLQIACEQLKQWHRDPQANALTLAVNVSAEQFRQRDFVKQVQQILIQSGAKPALLKLELTESTVLENVEDTIAKMRELKLLGISFSMDDFGTGYSSLQYLKRLPLDQIKIDQSFVRDIASDPNDAAIVQTIIAMSEVLGLDVIAEGVETEAQREFLSSRGCHAFQGYLFSRPVPLKDFETFLHG